MGCLIDRSKAPRARQYVVYSGVWNKMETIYVICRSGDHPFVFNIYEEKYCDLCFAVLPSTLPITLTQSVWLLYRELMCSVCSTVHSTHTCHMLFIGEVKVVHFLLEGV